MVTLKENTEIYVKLLQNFFYSTCNQLSFDYTGGYSVNQEQASTATS